MKDGFFQDILWCLSDHFSQTSNIGFHCPFLHVHNCFRKVWKNFIDSDLVSKFEDLTSTIMSFKKRRLYEVKWEF